jgi:hypothetical protein
MDMNTYVMIGIAVLSMFFGYFFGLFEGRGQGYKKRKKEEEEGTAEVAPEGEPEIPTEPPLAEANRPDLPETHTRPSLLCLSQDSDGSLQLELDDEHVDTTDLSGDQRRRLIALLTAMRPWLEGKRPRPTPPAPRPASPPAQPAAPEPGPTQPPVPVAVPDEVTEEAPAAPQSIVGQIDAILQSRIAGTALQGKGIKLQESPEGGVLVWVGLEKFQSVDEVTDEAIKSVIRAAIVEWEDKYTPNA